MGFTLHSLSGVLGQESELPQPFTITNLHKMTTPASKVITYSKTDLLKLRSSPLTSVFTAKPEFLEMLELTKSIPLREGADSEESTTSDELISSMLEKEEMRLAKKHRNFLRRERARQKKRELREISEEGATVKPASKKVVKPVDETTVEPVSIRKPVKAPMVKATRQSSFTEDLFK